MFYKGKTGLQRIETACLATWLLRASWFQPIHIPLGCNHVSALVLHGARSQAFPSILQNIPEPGGRPPFFTLMAKRNFVFNLSKTYMCWPGIHLCICYSRFFLNNRKWQSFYGWFGKVIYSLKSLMRLLINCYLISVQCLSWLNYVYKVWKWLFYSLDMNTQSVNFSSSTLCSEGMQMGALENKMVLKYNLSLGGFLTEWENMKHKTLTVCRRYTQLRYRAWIESNWVRLRV